MHVPSSVEHSLIVLYGPRTAGIAVCLLLWFAVKNRNILLPLISTVGSLVGTLFESSGEPRGALRSPMILPRIVRN
jgi:hypothetical protein